MKNNTTIILLIFFIIIPYTLEESTTNTTNSKNANTKNKQSSSSEKELTILQLFFIITSLFITVTLLIFGLSQLILLCCRKSHAFQKLTSYFELNYNISNELLYQIKYTYGTQYIIKFLTNKVFTSTKYTILKIKYFGDCTICMNEFKENEKVYKTSCEHIFHRKCMTDYLELIKKDIEKQNQHELNNLFKCPNCKQFLFFKQKIKNIKKNKKENSISDDDSYPGSTIKLQMVKNKKLRKAKISNNDNNDKNDFYNNVIMVNSNRNLENISTKNLPEGHLKHNIPSKFKKNRHVNKQSIAILRNNFVN